MDADTLTPNQTVAYNLARIRKLRGLTQTEAAALLAPHLGRHWSKASFSAAERSTDSGRARRFDADEIVGFAKVFDVPVQWFFLAPVEDREDTPDAVIAKELRQRGLIAQ